MTAMTSDYQRGYRAGLKAAKGGMTRDKEVRAMTAALIPHANAYNGPQAVARQAFIYAEAMEEGRNKWHTQ